MDIMKGREQEREMGSEGKRERERGKVNEKDIQLNIKRKYEGEEKRVEKQTA